MRARTVNEDQNFERGQDPKKSLGIGIQEKIDMAKGMKLLSIWLNNFDPDFIDKVWEGNMANHFKEKWKLAMSQSKYGYADPTSIMRFLSELSDGNKEMLFNYISEEYKDEWL